MCPVGGENFLFKKILNYLAWQFQHVNILSPINCHLFFTEFKWKN